MNCKSKVNLPGFLCVLFFLSINNFSSGQQYKKGDLILGYSIGPNFSNFINSAAPHKVYIYGEFNGEKVVQLPTGPVEYSVIYTDYKTGFLRDMLLGISLGLDIGYFLNERLSLQSHILYGSKGINLRYNNIRDGYLIAGSHFPFASYGEITEYYNTKITNSYISIPINLRYGITQNSRLYVEGGFYLAYLLSGRYSILIEKNLHNAYGNSHYKFYLDNEKDKDKEFTNHFDYGLVLGTGYQWQLSERTNLNLGLLSSIGFADLDKKYNNDYWENEIPGGSNLSSLLVLSENYYGLNSNASNISFVIRVGLGYRLGK